ncbi:MAG TPA: hypothetical protein VFZ53_08230 [Polyangiaceae bacterium]
MSPSKFRQALFTSACCAIAAAALTAACGGSPKLEQGGSVGTGGTAGVAPGSGGTGLSDAGSTTTGGSSTGGTTIIPPEGGCPTITCESLGWACGYTVDECGNRIDCATEGRMCAVNEVCTGGIDGPTTCVTGGAGVCPVCSGIPDCSMAAQKTMLTGRVITPGRDDANAANQVGVPNATVYLLRTPNVADLPAIPTGIPMGGTSCDRCEDQNLGPVLAGAITDATGAFTIEEYIPVGVEVLLVVKVGRFRRATTLTLPASAACQTTALPTTLPDNPTRLPRNMTDGLAVNIPRIAVTTGHIDAMECVLEKMGLSHAEFANPGGAERVNLYRGGPTTGTPAGTGARMDDSTPHANTLYGDAAALQSYDLVIADCEGEDWDEEFTERDASGANVREFVNRGGRMFASHWSYSWLADNGMDPYDPMNEVATGLGPAATWTAGGQSSSMGTGAISVGRPAASPRIQNFADWMVNERVTAAPDYTFSVIDPRNQNTGLGTSSEEFVYRQDGNNMSVQQFSFNTPYGAPATAACGRVAYSAFHVSASSGGMDFTDAIFPMHCTGDLTNQEKVLLYMLFDLGACIGDEPPPPPCVPEVCGEDRCGFAPDGCGDVLDCGPCRPPS